MYPRLLMMFVDGFGIGEPDPAINPLAGGVAPTLERWLALHSVSADACLGVPGLPQSATGQTTLLTGVNAALDLGGHFPGFPNERLRTLIREHNLFRRLHALGATSTFANAYYLEAMPERLRRRPPSVTTVAVQQAIGSVRTGADMRAGRAVFHDLTREGLKERGYEGAVLTPEEAARDLLAVVREQDFTLFEFFETDKAGHRGTLEDAQTVIRKLDRFAAELERGLDLARETLTLTSDHGNVEDMRTNLHTRNPVPFIAIGAHADALLQSVRSIADITPAILRLYEK